MVCARRVVRRPFNENCQRSDSHRRRRRRVVGFDCQPRQPNPRKFPTTNSLDQFISRGSSRARAGREVLPAPGRMHSSPVSPALGSMWKSSTLTGTRNCRSFGFVARRDRGRLGNPPHGPANGGRMSASAHDLRPPGCCPAISWQIAKDLARAAAGDGVSSLSTPHRVCPNHVFSRRITRWTSSADRTLDFVPSSPLRRSFDFLHHTGTVHHTPVHSLNSQ